MICEKIHKLLNNSDGLKKRAVTCSLSCYLLSFSGSLIASLISFCTSLEARLNSLIPLPNAFPTSGSLPGPKMIRAKTRMIINSGIPKGPINPNILFTSRNSPAYTCSLNNYAIQSGNMQPEVMSESNSLNSTGMAGLPGFHACFPKCLVL